jgi:RNA polymerase sporulation-specific sigma factor
MPLNTSVSLNLPVATEEDDHITLMDTIKAGTELNPEELMIHKENLEDLKRYMKNTLSPLEWDVINLHTAGKNYQEIAKSLGKTNKSIDNALQRIKRKMAQAPR